MIFKLNTRLLTKVLFIGLLLVIALNNLAVCLYYFGFLKGLVGFKIFSRLTVDFSSSLPTYLNTLLVVVAFLILLAISTHLQKSKSMAVYNWVLLTLAFLVLSLDENPSVHAFLVAKFSKYVITGQRLAQNYAWGMPYGAMVILFFIFLFRFIVSLPKDIGRGFIVSGLIYVFGAIILGMYVPEMLNIHGDYNIKRIALASIEESLELIGLTLFIYFLLRYIRTEFKPFVFETD